MAVASRVYPNGLKRIGMGDTMWKTTSGTDLDLTLILDTEPMTVGDTLVANLAVATGAGVTEALTELDPAISSADVQFDTNDTTVTFTGTDVGDAQTIGGVAVGTVTGDYLICINDFSGGNVTSDATNDIIVTPPATGWFVLSCSSW